MATAHSKGGGEPFNASNTKTIKFGAILILLGGFARSQTGGGFAHLSCNQTVSAITAFGGFNLYSINIQAVLFSPAESSKTLQTSNPVTL